LIVLSIAVAALTMPLAGIGSAAESIAPYSVLVTVHHDGTFHVQERISYDFGDEQRQFTAPIPETTLRDEVQRFRALLEKRTTNEYLVPARQLYDQIIRPIESVLAAHHIDTLVIVPDYTLRIVPFAALHDGKGFLVDRYAIRRT